MKFTDFQRQTVSLIVLVTFAALLHFWAAPATAATNTGNSETAMGRGDSGTPGFFEAESNSTPVIKKAKEFPWLLVGAMVVLGAAAAYYFLIVNKKYTLTVNLGTGTTGTPAVTASYNKDQVVNYSYTAQSDYSSLQVMLDNVVVTKSGTVTMNSNHTLSVSATETEATYKNGVLTVNGVPYDMASIADGTFQMGSNSSEAYADERPVHTVRISKRFWLGKTEVTQGLWQTVMGSNPSNFKKGDKYPVETVTWDDCQAFITTLNQMLRSNYFRLPTEAEWEYACRAGTTGDRYGNIDSIAWYRNNSGDSTHPVGQKQANAWGLFDTLGNAWEWCQDYFGDYSAGYQTDPNGPASGSFRVFRGSGWHEDVKHVRSAIRGRGDPDYRDFDRGILGFRLAAISAGN